MKIEQEDLEIHLDSTRSGRAIMQKEAEAKGIKKGRFIRKVNRKYRDQFGLTTDDELSYDPVTGQFIGSNAVEQ